MEPNSLRNRIQGDVWREMTRATDTVDVHQYHTLPDLGVYIRERMCSQSVSVPTSQAVAAESGVHCEGSARGVSGSVLAFAHSCCSSSAPQARQDAQSDISSSPPADAQVSLPESCTSAGCIHGSIVSVFLGSVIPLCRRASQCRRLYSTHAQVRSAISCCTLMEFTIVCSMVLALLLGLYPRGRKTAIFDVRVTITERMRRLVTCGSGMESRRSFLLGCIPVIQLAFAEYAYNFIVDYMPVEVRDTRMMPPWGAGD